MEKVLIALLNYNGKKDTIEALNSIKELKNRNFEIVVIDNDSTDGSIEAIQTYDPSIPILSNKKNLGYAGGNNVGMRFCIEHDFSHLLILNNDLVVDTFLLDAFLKASNMYTQTAIFGSLVYTWDHQIEHFGGFWDPSKAQFVSHKIVDGEAKLVDYVCGCTLFMPRWAIEKIGLFDERFFLLWEESDLCLRAKNLHYEVRAIASAKVRHKISRSFSGGKAHMDYYWWRNRLLWIEKNVALQQKKRLYTNILSKEIKRLYKHYFLKKIQCFFFPNEHRKNKLRRLSAAKCGIEDFFKQRFGMGPEWITSKSIRKK